MVESGFSGLKELALHLFQSVAVVDTGFSRVIPSKKMPWFVSRSDDPGYPQGSEYRPSSAEISGTHSLRLVGFDLSCIKNEPSLQHERSVAVHQQAFDPVAAAPERVPGKHERAQQREEFSCQTEEELGSGASRGFPFFRGRGVVEETTACFLMFGKYMNVPVKKDLIQSIIGNQYARNGQISLQDCGGVGVVLGLKSPGGEFRA